MMASVSLGKPVINEMRWLGQEYCVYCAAVTFVRQLNSKIVVPVLRTKITIVGEKLRERVD